MGWNTGGDIADEVWSIVNSHIDAQKRARVAYALITLFEGYDCDVMQETALWDVAFERCDECYPKLEENYTFRNQQCVKCRGRFWKPKKEVQDE